MPLNRRDERDESIEQPSPRRRQRGAPQHAVEPPPGNCPRQVHRSQEAYLETRPSRKGSDSFLAVPAAMSIVSIQAAIQGPMCRYYDQHSPERGQSASQRDEAGLVVGDVFQDVDHEDCVHATDSNPVESVVCQRFQVQVKGLILRATTQRLELREIARLDIGGDHACAIEVEKAARDVAGSRPAFEHRVPDPRGHQADDPVVVPVRSAQDLEVTLNTVHREFCPASLR